MRRAIAAIAITATAGITAGSIAVVSSNNPIAPAAAAPSSAVIHYVVVSGDSWIGIANQYGLSGNDLARQNRSTISASLQPGMILHIIPGTTTTTSTTLPASTTSTTVTPTSTTSTPATTTTTTTTTVPPLEGFVDTFTDDEGWRSRWELDVHHRADLAGGQVDIGKTWRGDHDMACGGADSIRTLNAAPDRSQHFYRCGTENGVGSAHVMTSMGDVDGYSTLSMSPFQVFPVVHRVCWDQSVTDAGGRAWTEALVVPATKIDDGDLTHVNPEFVAVDEFTKQHDATTWGVMIMPNYFGLRVFANATTEQADDGFGNDSQGFQSRAIRRQHCLIANPNNTITMTVDQGTGGVYSHTFSGHFPTNARVIFEQHAYTPDKDGEACRTTGTLTGCRYTWHWDNVTIE